MTATLDTIDLTAVERENAAMLDAGLWLGGRHFRRQLRGTFERNIYTVNAARETGLAKAGQGFDPLHDTLGDHTEGLILNAFLNRSMYQLLAGVLGEDGVAWSPELAAENAAFFASLTEPEDQASLFDIAGAVLMDFFLNAAGSWRIFLNYLSRAANQNPNETEPTETENESDASADATITASPKRQRPSGMDLIADLIEETPILVNGTPL